VELAVAEMAALMVTPAVAQQMRQPVELILVVEAVAVMMERLSPLMAAQA
jgi:hypothetical protein